MLVYGRAQISILSKQGHCLLQNIDFRCGSQLKRLWLKNYCFLTGEVYWDANHLRCRCIRLHSQQCSGLCTGCQRCKQEDFSREPTVQKMFCSGTCKLLMILVHLDIKIKGSVSHNATKICMGGSENHECQNCFCNVVKSPKNKPVTRELNWVLGDLIQ